MAKQNIISGGFYGKVGQLVGQRWHNIRTVRSYVIPHNPRTEKQQANRYAFAKVTENAQIAMQMNYHTPAFDTSDNSEWALRMSSGSMLAKGGNTGFNLIPLFPYGYIPEYTLKKITLKEKRSTTSAIFEVEGDLPDTNREISVLIGYKNTEEEEYTIDLYTALLLVGDTCTFELQMADNSVLNAFTKFLIVTNDDVRNDNKMLFCPQTLMSEPEIIERDFNAEVVGIERDNTTFTITLAEPYIEAETTLKNFSVNGVSSGVFKTSAINNAQLIEHNGYFAIQFEQSVATPSDIYAFPTGSEITIEEISAVNDHYNLHSTNVEKDLISTDLQRTLDCTMKESGTLSGNTLIVFNQPFFFATYAKKSASAKAIINGTLQTFTPSLGSVAGRSSFLAITIDKSSYTYTDTPIFTDGSSVTFGGIRGEVNGVTYIAENFTVEPRDTETSLKFDATIESISRSGSKFKITTSNKYVPSLNYAITADVTAVSNGLQVTKSAIPLSFENDNGKLAFSFTQTVQHEAELYAFPTGSSIALKAVQATPAWGYTPSVTTAQAVSSSDLERKMWVEMDSGKAQTGYGSIFLKQKSAADGSISVNNLKMENVTLYGSYADETYSARVSDNKVELRCTFPISISSYVAPAGCKIKWDNLEISSMGVKYTAQESSINYTYIEGSANWQSINPDKEITVDELPAKYFEMHPTMERLYEPTDWETWLSDWSTPRDIEFNIVSTAGDPIAYWDEGYLDDYADNSLLLQMEGDEIESGYRGTSVEVGASFTITCVKLGFTANLSMNFNTVIQ